MVKGKRDRCTSILRCHTRLKIDELKAKRRRELVKLLSGELAMMAYTKHQQGKKVDSERLKGEGDQIKFIDLRFESWQVVRFRKARRRQDVP